ncbi:MBL fold metallo-hydrolase [Thermotoga sp. SG1]|uniref:MBL fold metallo-hydrolase n=1 Tax=Thermotoga sp. SG1 TaxID=126739 RepID=UPI000C75EE0B|nr:MBL fold metallo-hydrolase [Thermotoga sp. SG1]PLV57517.1 MBL fold metallo-hydrolase [Thermotoga sp. SG1]
MKITWFGHACFSLEIEGITIVTDPFDESVGYPIPNVTANVVTESHQHFDHNAHHLVKGNFRLINSPGSYTVDGVKIKGIETFHDSSHGRERGKNIAFVFEGEGLRVCHLGDLGHVLTPSQVKEIGEVDVLLVPVGGTYTIGPREAKEVSGLLEAKFIIPMHYKTKYLKFNLLPVDEFLKLFEKHERVGNILELFEKPTERKIVVMEVQ